MPLAARRPILLLLVGALSCSSGSKEPAGGPWTPGQPLTLDVGAVFPAGTALRDGYGGGAVTVSSGGTVTVQPGAAGLVLLERDGAAAAPFSWKNSTVYFALTDRFANGSTANDTSYGRAPDGADEVGTWHGGDWVGLTGKLDYLASLGVDAIWISPIVEQVHGWVAGGSSGAFQHYAYHGYWALDFTRLDASFGTEAELQALVDGAHQRGMRVLVDVVMNHPGYATGADLVAYLPEVIDETCFAAFTPSTSRLYFAWNDCVDYQSPSWASWWGPGWVRAGLGGGYTGGGSTDTTLSLSFLPDFKTEAADAVPVPTLFTRKAATAAGTGVTALPGSPTVRDYLVSWHAGWVRRFGIDGFRADTAKHVELASWKALKDAAAAALADWKAANPTKKLDDAPFWMTGEVFSHGLQKDAYYTDGGFDSLLDFSFQPQLLSLLQTRSSLAAAATELDARYAAAAALVSTDPAFDVLTYLSSHDTQLFFDGLGASVPKYLQAGTALFLAPGGIQIFYGDESGRRVGPSGGDSFQVTRSDMNWATSDAAILAHWQKLGAFRKRHAAIGAGAHARLTSPEGSYAFSRRLPGAAGDAVVVVVAPPVP